MPTLDWQRVVPPQTLVESWLGDESPPSVTVLMKSGSPRYHMFEAEKPGSRARA